VALDYRVLNQCWVLFSKAVTRLQTFYLFIFDQTQIFKHLFYIFGFKEIKNTIGLNILNDFLTQLKLSIQIKIVSINKLN